MPTGVANLAEKGLTMDNKKIEHEMRTTEVDREDMREFLERKHPKTVSLTVGFIDRSVVIQPST